MKFRRQPMPRRVTVFICTGLLLATMPLLFKEYINIPDFARGAIEGLGIGLEFTGLLMFTRIQRANSSVCDTENSDIVS